LGEDGRLTFVMDTALGKEALVQIHEGVGTILKTSEQEPVGRVVGMDGTSILINNGSATNLYTVQQKVIEPPTITAKIEKVTSVLFTENQSYAPGEIISIFGKNLCGQTSESPLPINQALTLPLPTQLGLCQVLLDGKLIPISFAWSSSRTGDGQINALIPMSTTPGLRRISVRRLKSSLELDQQTLERDITVTAVSPVFFGNSDYPVFMQNNSQGGVLVGSDSPARAGDVITIYATGLGLTNPVAPDGGVPLRLATVETDVVIRIKKENNKQAEFRSAEILAKVASPQFPGVYQLSFRIPENFRHDGPVIFIDVEVAGKVQTFWANFVE
jgi:uncharacterized protein (TIGR03437 family)